MEKKSLFKEFSKGIIKENPVLCLVLGTCPTLAVTTSASNAIGMGVAATAVLVCSNMVISLLRKVIPGKVRIPAYITIIAGFVTIVQMLVQAFAPAINDSLGIYLPLIVVNCIILGRAEMFASKNGVGDSALDGLGMGLGFKLALFIISYIREILGSGSWLGMSFGSWFQPIVFFVTPAGGFFVFGCVIAIVNAVSNAKGKKPKESFGCENCPSRESCAGKGECQS